MGQSWKKTKIEVVPVSGNVFRDTRYPNSDEEQAKAILAAEKKTGFSHTDFSRIKKPDLGRFTIDRLMNILNRLAPDTDINMEFRHRSKRKKRIAKEQTALNV